MSRFVKGQSGNPDGRPRKRRPNVSAFDIVFDKRLTVTQNGIERELSVDEALELKTYQAAIGGNRPAMRQVVKMIEKREKALKASQPPVRNKPIPIKHEHDARNADEAMLILGIAVRDPTWIDDRPGDDLRLKLATWAVQAGISRPGRRRLSERDVEEVRRQSLEPERLKWPRGSRHG